MAYRLRHIEGIKLYAKSHKPIANCILFYQNIGEMSELAEGARLEIVCAAKSGTEGSNPSLSAIN